MRHRGFSRQAGSMHIADFGIGIFGANGIVGTGFDAVPARA
jgi:TPP-dependent pyruvate/acetoin dehydrogenase alpha subunit